MNGRVPAVGAMVGHRLNGSRSESHGDSRVGIRGAFTIVEVLVVAAIVLVLVGVAVPVSLHMVSESKSTRCLGKLRNIGMALESYLVDHNNFYPDIEMLRVDAEDEGVLTLEMVLADYVEGPDAFHCPADREQFARSGSSYLWNSTQSGRHRLRTSFFGAEGQPDRVPLVLDKEAFHGGPSGMNMLFADYRLSKNVEFGVGAK